MLYVLALLSHQFYPRVPLKNSAKITPRPYLGIALRASRSACFRAAPTRSPETIRSVLTGFLISDI